MTMFQNLLRISVMHCKEFCFRPTDRPYICQGKPPKIRNILGLALFLLFWLGLIMSSFPCALIITLLPFTIQVPLWEQSALSTCSLFCFSSVRLVYPLLIGPKSAHFSEQREALLQYMAPAATPLHSRLLCYLSTQCWLILVLPPYRYRLLWLARLASSGF